MKHYLFIFVFLNIFNSIAVEYNDSLTVYLKTAQDFYTQREYQKAKNEIRLSFKHTKKNQSNYNLGKEYLLLGKIYKEQSYLDTALQNFNLALDNFESDIDSDNRAEVYLEKGRIFRRKAEYSKAFSSFHQSLKLFEQLNDSAKIGSLKLNIGNVFNEIRRFSYAIKSYKEAIYIYTKLDLESGLSGCYNNLGNIYTYKEIFDSASYYLYKSLEIRIKKGDYNQAAYTYQNLTSVYLQQKKIDSAMLFIQKSLAIHKDMPNSYELHMDYYFIGEIYKEKNNYKKAYEYYKKTFEWAKENKAYQLLPEVCLSIGVSLYEGGKKNKSAYYFNQYKIYKDTLHKDDYKIEESFINYEFVKDSMMSNQLNLQKEISEIENSNLELKKKMSNNNFMYLLIVILILIISTFLIYYSVKKRLNQSIKHKQIVESQNKELKRTLISKEEKEILLKEVHHRVKNNLQIISSLIRLQTQYTSAENYQSKINDTENRIRSMALVHEKLYKNEDISKLNAKAYIEELSENIYHSLKTKTEIKFIINIPDINLKIDTLIPLGLIINEIVSNSIKYAFPNTIKGMIKIEIDNETKVLKVIDNGIGTKLTYNELSKDSLGMELIETLSDQLDAILEFNGVNGFNYTIKFKQLV